MKSLSFACKLLINQGLVGSESTLVLLLTNVFCSVRAKLTHLIAVCVIVIKVFQKVFHSIQLFTLFCLALLLKGSLKAVLSKLLRFYKTLAKLLLSEFVFGPWSS